MFFILCKDKKIQSFLKLTKLHKQYMTYQFRKIKFTILHTVHNVMNYYIT